MTAISERTADEAELPRWSLTDVHESMTSRTFVDAIESLGAGIERATAEFDRNGIGAIEPRPATAQDGDALDAALRAHNEASMQATTLRSYVYANVSTNSRDEAAQGLLSEISVAEAKLSPLLSRLADWVSAIHEGSGGPAALESFSELAADHAGPLQRLAERSLHQMSEPEENLYSELNTTGPLAWARLHRDVSSQLEATVTLADTTTTRLPIAAVRGLATHEDPVVRRNALAAELAAWPTVAVAAATALNAIKGDAIAVGRRRSWNSPLDASLFANAVSRPTYDAMMSAIVASLDDFRGWMHDKATLHGSDAGLHWADLVAPAPVAPAGVTWQEGVDVVRAAFSDYSPQLGSLVDRAIDERWIDAAPRDGKTGGAFCMPFIGGRSLVLLNWTGSADSTQTTAHELGHAYHNTTLAERTSLQRRLPMALAETASIFCETLVVERGLGQLQGAERLAMLDVDLVGTNQVIVDIYSRLLFESELFARRERRTLGVSELNEMMLQAQVDAYGDGLDKQTAHPYMWAVKPHYYGSHFYNWPYAYGLLFGLGLFARYREDPERFRAGYETLLSRAGMDTAQQLGESFGLDVTDEAFWAASLDVIRSRMADYRTLAGRFVAGDLSDGTPS